MNECYKDPFYTQPEINGILLARWTSNQERQVKASLTSN